jgi:hypothetical protein
VQLQVGSNGYTAADGSAPQRFFDDAVLGLKFHLLDQKGPRPALALSGALSIPTFAGQDGYLRTWDAFFTGYVSKDVGPIHGDLNVGLNVWRFEAGPRPQAWGALALSANLAAPFGVLLEGYAFSSAAPVSTQDGGVRFGVTLAPKGWLTLDVGGDVGVFPAVRSFSAFAGLTVIPAVLWR